MERLLKKYALSAGLFLVLIIGFSAYSSSHSASTVPQYRIETSAFVETVPTGALKSGKNVDEGVISAHWKERIRAVGGVAAYKEFGVEALGYELGAHHMLAHLFGRVLYQVEGLSGVSVCGSNYYYGCSHQFVGEAITAQGIAAAAILNDICQQQSTLEVITCQHGIGHGVQAYFGYTEKDLLKALDICATFSDAALGGCYTGAFMEYNERLMISKNLGMLHYLDMRPLGKDDDYVAPCNKVDKLYRPACVFQQVQWWYTALIKDDRGPATFVKLGKMCHTLSKEIGMNSLCFQGVGMMTGKDPTLAKSLCEASSKDKNEQLQCRAYSAHANSARLGVSEGLKFCDGLTGADAKYCESYAHDRFWFFGTNLSELLQ